MTKQDVKKPARQINGLTEFMAESIQDASMRARAYPILLLVFFSQIAIAVFTAVFMLTKGKAEAKKAIICKCLSKLFKKTARIKRTE